MNLVLFNTDLIAQIFSHHNLLSNDYKSVIATCTIWYDTIASPKRAHAYMDVINTFMQNRKPILDVGCAFFRLDMIEPLIPENPSYDFIQSISWIHKNPHLTIEFIKKHISLFSLWDFLCSSALKLDIVEICHCFDRENQLACIQQLPLEVLTELITQTDDLMDRMKLHIASNENLTMEFIDTYGEYLKPYKCWASNSNFTLDYIYKNISRLGLRTCSRSPVIDDQFVIKYKNELSRVDLYNNPRISAQLTEELLCEDLELKITPSNFLWQSSNITTDLIRKYINHVEWKHVRYNPNLDDAFKREFAVELGEFKICLRTATLRELENHIETMDKYDWRTILLNPNITIEFMREHALRFKGILYE